MEEQTFDTNSNAVSTILTIKANIINRLASNSNVCKTLSVTIAGVLVGFNSTLPWPHLIFVIFSILALMILDSMYMGLKKSTEKISKEIIKNATTGKKIDPYIVDAENDKDRKKTIKTAIKVGFGSITIRLFYAIMIVGLIAVKLWPCIQIKDFLSFLCTCPG